MSTENSCTHEYDFALILTGLNDLSDEAAAALFDAGCDDATPSVQYGQVYMEFSREAESLQHAILSAIRDVRLAKIGADVLRVDECHLVTPAEIARKIGRSRQQVYQYMTGVRGPGGFPAPACHLTEGKPLWAWCAVSYWFCENDIIQPELFHEAEVISAINNALEQQHQMKRNPKLVKEVAREVEVAKS